MSDKNEKKDIETLLGLKLRVALRNIEKDTGRSFNELLNEGLATAIEYHRARFEGRLTYIENEGRLEALVSVLDLRDSYVPEYPQDEDMYIDTHLMIDGRDWNSIASIAEVIGCLTDDIIDDAAALRLLEHRLKYGKESIFVERAGCIEPIKNAGNKPRLYLM